MNPCETLLRSARNAPDKVAIVWSGSNYTYSDVSRAAHAFATGLARHGLGANDAVGIMLPNVALFPIAAYGAWINGNIVVPMNVLLRPREIQHVLTDSKVRALITSPFSLAAVLGAVAELEDPPLIFVAGGNANELPPLAKAAEGLLANPPTNAVAVRPASDHVLTLYTSGTTGLPKGAMISAGNLAAQTEALSACFRVEADDRLLCVLPLFHAFAFNALMQPAFANEGTIVLQPRFDVEQCVRSLVEDDISWFAGVPTMYAYLLAATDKRDVRFPKLRVAVTGGAPPHLPTLEQFEQRFGVPVYEGYGLTETTVGVSTNCPGGHRLGSVGRPYRHVSVRIVNAELEELPVGEVGTIQVRGPNVMLGYLGLAAATEDVLAGGWFTTGDLGSMDADGFLYISGRKTDMIIKGGYNVYPREVEHVLRQVPGVAEVSVVGVGDELKGELIRAVVALSPGAVVDEATLRSHAQEYLAKYKHPNEYRFVRELPKCPLGKVLKAELRA
jgi:long-chain acyl-CoA synthetase